MERKPRINPEFFTEHSVDLQGTHSLILFNDDYNQYEFVIDSLVEVCKHNRLQAEQCTLIAHHNGKCDVKSGNHNQLQPLREELLRRGLSATITPKSN
ncbi:MAG: ATP-dependent Clp protease adaptor ClpS [Tenuifilaceae bacterium]|jgi:ATP-dependent Clp protease adaptor protein ClpS|nr:ATP-dependent Clp protease adaptor ClpS [Tenuifilaceae bacterium]